MCVALTCAAARESVYSHSLKEMPRSVQHFICVKSPIIKVREIFPLNTEKVNTCFKCVNKIHNLLLA